MGSGASVNVGPLRFDGNGLHVEPKFDFGYEDDNVNVGIGVGDLRNGVGFRAAANVGQSFKGEGSGFQQFIRSLESEGAAKKVIDPLLKIVPRIIAEVMRLLGVDIKGGHFEGSLLVEVGVGGEVKGAFGWKDSEGYNMVGAKADLSAGVEMGFGLFCGAKNNKVKIHVEISNATIDAIVTL